MGSDPFAIIHYSNIPFFLYDKNSCIIRGTEPPGDHRFDR